MGYIRKIRHVIRSTARYFLYVCRNDDYDWDYCYLLNLLQWKANRMADNMGSSGIAESNNRTAKQLRYLADLIERYYVEEANVMEQYYTKYGIPKHEFVSIEGSRNKRMVTTYSSDEAKMEILPAMQRAQAAEQKIKKRIFRHMEKYLEHWWD